MKHNLKGFNNNNNINKENALIFCSEVKSFVYGFFFSEQNVFKKRCDFR